VIFFIYALFAALVAAVFEVRAVTPIFSSSCGLPHKATLAIFKYSATQLSIIDSDHPSRNFHR
jgi:hypothetical protein